MPTGRIKYFNSDKGFGFIAQDSGEADVFMHVSAVQWAYDEINVGQRVEYEVVEGSRGLVAQGVEVILSPIDRKRLSQGKTVIPRDYPRSKKKSDTAEKPSNSDQVSDQSTPGPAPTSPEPQQEVDSSSAQTETAESTSDQHTRSARRSKGKTRAKAAEQPTFGDLYMQKQIRLQTPMFFGLYDHLQLPVTVSEFTKYDFILLDGEEKRELPKTDVKYCYKAEDAEKVQAAITYNEEIRAQKLKPVIARSKRYHIETQAIRHARTNRYPIEVTMREGEIFRGSVDWVSRYEIKMILENGSKVVVFRHAICDFKAFPSKTQAKDQGPAEDG